MDKNFRKSIEQIDEAGALLVFPIKNAKEPDSLWRRLHPKSQMRWEWDSGGDNKVANMWYRMKKLSDCKEVVYSKWYQGRATFFSRELFTALLTLARRSEKFPPLSREAHMILRQLEMNSPLSTKEIKKLTHLQGKFYEGAYNKAMKELFQRFLIVGFGEVDDGAFPSLAVGATESLYEKLWLQSNDMSEKDAMKIVNKFMPKDSKMRNVLEKTVLRRPPEK
ncbi:MAG: hypothetical protein AABZ31_14845, partial [Bdellovibrionota bacterium]